MSPEGLGNSMGERRRYRRVKVRLPLSFTVLEPEAEETHGKDRPSEDYRISARTYDVSMEGLTIDAMLSPEDTAYLMSLIARAQRGPRIDVNVEFEGDIISMAATVIWYNVFFPGTPPPNFKAGLYLIEPDSNPSKQKWNDFIENMKV